MTLLDNLGGNNRSKGSARTFFAVELISFYCTQTGDRARRIAEINYDQDKMIERGKALQCSTRQGRRESKKYSKPDKRLIKKKKTERLNKQKNNRKNSDEDEDEDEDKDDGKEGTDEEEEDIEENKEVDKEEGSEMEGGRDDDEVQVKVKGKGASNQKNQSRVEEKMSDYYNDDVDETFGKKLSSFLP